ncbi:MAG: hypothetical protein KGL35_09645, partial [Bradyrhizobium sp.]|nr:hypothetical protein [Bradyrhizobium sp.]
LGSNECEQFKEWIDGTGDQRTAHCIMRRKGYPDDFHKTFSVADAKKAELFGKAGPWQTYPDRMLQWRATGFTARAAFADKLSGLILAEEAMDYPETSVIDVTPTVPEDRLARVPEGLRDNLDRAFQTLALSPAQILVKVNEYLGGDGDPEEGATNLLRWCRDEFSRRKTGQPMKPKGDGNGKPKPESAPAPPADPGGDPRGTQRSDHAGVDASVEDRGVGRADSAGVSVSVAAPEGSAAPLTAADVGFRSQDLGF